MKILNIYFKNINSLEGESRIHFDQPPIADGGVFAITGPNGSGKSSVLDVITLGLYGETFRFDRPADHVMTKSTSDSFAHVEFSLGDAQFRSSWLAKRVGDQATGELLAPKMKLVQLNGSEQVLEESTQKVRDRIAELSGMDFHKFSKSMILAQGDFAAFLNALDSERMDILEKISSEDIYLDYKKQVEEKNTEAQTQLNFLEQDLAAIPLLDDATREANEHDLIDFKGQQTELENEQNDVQQQLVEIQNKNDLARKVEELANKKQQVESELDENQKIIEKIDASQDIAGLQDDLTTIDNKFEESQQSKKTLDSYRGELEMLQKQLKSSGFDENSNVPDATILQQKNNIDELQSKFSALNSDLPKESALLQALNQQIEEKKLVFQTTSSWLLEHSGDKRLVDNFPDTIELKTIRGELAELTEKKNVHINWSTNTSDKLVKTKTEIETLLHKKSELVAQIKLDESALESIAEGHSLKDLQNLQVEQQERVNNFVELLELAKVNAKLGRKGLFGQIFSGKDGNKEEQLLKEESDQLKIEIGLEKNIIQTLELAISNELLLKKMEEDRLHLVDGAPCPLCGALEHPFSKHAPVSTIATSRQALADQKKKIKVLTTNAKDLGKQIVSVQKQTKQDDQKDSKLQIVNSQWRNLANRLNSSSMELNIDNLSLMKDLLKNEKKELANIGQLIKKYSKQEKLVTKAKSAIESNEVILTRLNKEIDSLDTEKKSRPDHSPEQEQAYSQYQEQEQTLAKKVLEQLSEFSEHLPEPGEEDALIHRLNIRKQEYQSRSGRHQLLSEEIKTLEGKITTCSSQVDQINQQIKQCSEQVQQQEIAGLHLSLIEKQKLIAEKEKLFSQQEADVNSLKQHLSDKFSEPGSTKQVDLKEMKETLALAERQPEFQQKQQVLVQNAQTISTDLNSAQNQLEAMQTSQVNDKTEEELQQQQKSITEKLDIAKQEVDSLQNKLSKQDGLKEKFAEQNAKVASQKAIVDSFDADIKLVSDENNLEFRRKVQQVMADKLLSQANQILEKISGRYFVRKVESEHGLALEIEDTKQKNVRRLPKTLSGGESFIVSLALALGLSEMTNDSYAINSLFLDEGFGNLDAESLYLAMTTLESLKTHGKIVGVISHVDGVRKRIKTQIEMIKKPNGLSGLKVIS